MGWRTTLRAYLCSSIGSKHALKVSVYHCARHNIRTNGFWNSIVEQRRLTSTEAFLVLFFHYPPPPLSFPTPGKTVPHHPLGDGCQVTVPHPPLGDRTTTVHAPL